MFILWLILSYIAGIISSDILEWLLDKYEERQERKERKKKEW